MSAIDVMDALHSTGIFVGQCGKEDTMEDVVVVGVDLAKSVFQVHGIDADAKLPNGGTDDPGEPISDPAL